MDARLQTPDVAVDAVPLVGLDEIRAAAERLAGVTLRTPLVPFGPPLDGDPRGRTRAWLKPESLQPIGAFKLRGAYNLIARLPAEALARGVVAHSSGNHAQGVARAARLLRTRAVIVMPTGAPAVKARAVEADGATIVWVGASSDERADRAARIAAEDGMALVPSYDHRDIVAGQGTCGLEIAEQVMSLQDPPGGPFPPHAFTVLVPIGGGGLASGVAAAVKQMRPDATVIGVEPALAADAHQSLREGRIVRWEPEQVSRTSADGMRTTQLSDLTFRHLRRFLDGVVVVSEEEIAHAMLRAARGARLVVEPSGATPLAALLHHGDELPIAGPVICLLSGGNVDADRYRELLALGETLEPAA